MVNQSKRLIQSDVEHLVEVVILVELVTRWRQSQIGEERRTIGIPRNIVDQNVMQEANAKMVVIVGKVSEYRLMVKLQNFV